MEHNGETNWKLDIYSGVKQHYISTQGALLVPRRLELFTNFIHAKIKIRILKLQY